MNFITRVKQFLFGSTNKSEQNAQKIGQSLDFIQERYGVSRQCAMAIGVVQRSGKKLDVIPRLVKADALSSFDWSCVLRDETDEELKKYGM